MDFPNQASLSTAIQTAIISIGFMTQNCTVPCIVHAENYKIWFIKYTN